MHVITSILWLGFATFQGLAGQTDQASPIVFRGKVLDPQEYGIVGATVEIRSSELSLRTVTDGRGHFEFNDVSPSAYEISVRMRNFETFHKHQTLTQPLTDISITLQLAGATQEVVVTASLPDFVPSQEIPGREIDDAATHDLALFLREQPGINSFRRGPINLEPTIRGLQETQIAMFVDGTRTFAAGPARMDSDLSHVSPHIVQSVQAIKGPYALTWGAGALSAMQIRTFRPPFYGQQFELHGRFGYQYGANGVSHDGFGNFWGGTDRLRLHLFYNRRQGHDYRAGDDQTVPGDYQSNDVHWSLGFQPTPELLVEYVAGYQEQRDIDYPGRLLDASYFFTRSHSWEVAWSPLDGSISELSAQFYLNLKDHLMNNDEKPTARPAPGRVPPFPLRVDLPTESNTLGGHLSGLWKTGLWDLRLGLDFYNSYQNASRTISRRDQPRVLFRDIVWPEANIDNQGAYGQLIHQGERSQVGATLRVDFVQASAGTTSGFFSDRVSSELNREETNYSAALNGTFEPTDYWTVSAGLGRAARTANTLERYSDRFPSTKFQLSAEFMGNPSLRPEKSLELSLGNTLWLPRSLLQVDVFYRRIDDYITVSPDSSLPRRLPLSPPTVFRYFNGEQAHFYGGEARLDLELSPHLRGRGSLGYVWGEDTLLNEPLLGIPPLQGRLGLRLHSLTGTHWLDFSATLVDAQRRVALSRFERQTPGYAVFDLKAQTRLSSDWTLRVGIENLGNRLYSSHLNSLNPFSGLRVPEMGRNFYLGVEYFF